MVGQLSLLVDQASQLQVQRTRSTAALQHGAAISLTSAIFVLCYLRGHRTSMVSRTLLPRVSATLRLHNSREMAHDSSHDSTYLSRVKVQVRRMSRSGRSSSKASLGKTTTPNYSPQASFIFRSKHQAGHTSLDCWRLFVQLLQRSLHNQLDARYSRAMAAGS